ncbi:MAG: hypothetical protein MUD11_08665 [Rhodobacteraceae bacterium]|jgi:hypothetical protein|nr:hypothetical protein [Paracoccaceae bacterium]
MLRFATLALATLCSAASAQDSEIVFQRGAWLVEIVRFDDGELACSARVTEREDTFAIWVFQDGYTQLQLYSPDWQFGETSANLVVQIDRRAEWTLNNAQLTQNSVLFNLTDEDDAVDLLVEIARGNTFKVRNEQGQAVIDFTLAGSSASMQTLGDCEIALGRVGANPFTK